MDLLSLLIWDVIYSGLEILLPEEEGEMGYDESMLYSLLT